MAFLQRFSFFLAPSLLTIIVSFVMVPVTTYRLGPDAFGVFGLMSTVTVVGWTVSFIGSSAVCNIHFLKLELEERRRLMSTLLCVALAIGCVFCALCLALWPLAVKALHGFASVPGYGLAMSLFTVILGIPWMVAQDVITLDGRARGFAALTIAQTLANAFVTVTALYVFHTGVAALFISAIAGSAVTAAGALWILRPYLTTAVSRRWAREVMSMGPANAWASVSDAFQAAIERTVLASTFGVSALGLYVHAQNYRVMIAQVLNAAARPIWPVTLLEARETGAPFRQTRAVWDTMYLGVTGCGITFAVFGSDIIGWLTHGRFIEASGIVPFLIIFLLVQNAGKPQIGVLYREGAIRELYWVQVAANVAWFLFLMVFIRVAGLVGGALALIAQMTLFRLGVFVLSRSRGLSPFADGWLIAGIGLIATTMIVMTQVPATPGAKLVVWLPAMGLLSVAAFDVIRRFVRMHVPSLLLVRG